MRYYSFTRTLLLLLSVLESIEGFLNLLSTDCYPPPSAGSIFLANYQHLHNSQQHIREERGCTFQRRMDDRNVAPFSVPWGLRARVCVCVCVCGYRKTPRFVRMALPIPATCPLILHSLCYIISRKSSLPRTDTTVLKQLQNIYWPQISM
uniref:Putative secreted protein n=1 Tax=Anopheles marajoara TaxID=58244 RepID=A0A2M4C7E0_9DIPT